MKRIQSRLYEIGTYDVCKISLSYSDDKKYILDDGIYSLPYFPKDMRSQQNWTKLMKLMKSSKVNKVKLIKNWFMVTIFCLLYFSSIVIEGTRTKWSVIFFNCVLQEK